MDGGETGQMQELDAVAGGAAAGTGGIAIIGWLIRRGFRHYERTALQSLAHERQLVRTLQAQIQDLQKEESELKQDLEECRQLHNKASNDRRALHLEIGTLKEARHEATYRDIMNETENRLLKARLTEYDIDFEDIIAAVQLRTPK